MLAAATDGWVGSYYTGSAPNSSPALVRHDAVIDFDWGARSGLNSAADSDGTSARWESNLQSDHTAIHQLILRTNPLDGVRVWADNQLLVDRWAGVGLEQLTADVALVANQSTPMRVEYRDISGDAKMWLGWTSPQLPIEVLGPEWTPLSQTQRDTLDNVAARGTLFEQLSNVAGDYLDTGDVDPVNLVSAARLEATTVNAASTTSEAQRLRGYIVPQESGNYQFRISGGSQNRLLLADDATPELARVIASTTAATNPGQWTAQDTQTSDVVKLVAGVKYYFEARQTSSGAYGGLAIQWLNSDSANSTANSTWQSISSDELRPVMGEVGVRAIASSVNETDASAILSFDVSRSDDFGRALDVTLDYGGTATRGVDYTGAVSTVTIPAGQRSTRVNITVAADEIDEVRETIEVGLAPSDDYLLTTPARTRTTLSIFGNLAPAGSSIIPANPLRVSNIDDTNGTTFANFSNRTANGENGGTINGDVLIVETTSQPSNATAVNARWDITQDITDSETVYAEFYYRQTGGSAATGFWRKIGFQLRETNPWRDWGYTELTAKGFWQRAQIPITPGDALSAGSVFAELHLGPKDVSRIEIANFQVKRFFDDIANSVSVLPADAALLSNVDRTFGTNNATFTNRTAAPAEQVPFSDVLGIDIQNSANFLTQIRAEWNSDVAVEADSLLTASIWLRSGDAPFDVRLEIDQSGATNRLLRENFEVTGQWEKYEFSFPAREASVAGEISYELQMGRSLGLLEIGGVHLYNQGVAPDLTQFLPQSFDNYQQRESDSQWRIEAQQSVLDNRRNELTVNVTDLAGNAIPGATVEVNQVEHAYKFGNILKSEFIADVYSQSSTPESQRHQAIASRLFNTITIANGVRWRAWDSNEQIGRQSVDWVNENVRDLHGHHLTWGQFSMIPPAVTAEYDRLLDEAGQSAATAYLRQAQLDHVADIASELSGTIEGTDRPKIAHWDVANHPTLIKELWNILREGGSLAGPVGEVFDVAAANAHPDTLLIVNEGQTIERDNPGLRTDYYNLVRDLLANGKQVEGIGFMNHFGFNNSPSPTQFNDYLNLFATHGLPLLMTEFDINATGTDLQTQADWSEDYYLNTFANQATIGVIGYGFWELAHWRKDEGAHWYDANWEAKPNGEVFVDQIHREWQTNAMGSTRTDGSYRTMAFDGSHQVTVTVEGQTYQAMAEVDAVSGEVNFLLDVENAVADRARIEAEGFDRGGQGVGYSDTNEVNTGGAFRADEGVDIGQTPDVGGGYNVGWIANGEWLNYTVDVTAGTYDVDFRVSTPNTGRQIRLLIADDDSSAFTLLGTVDVPETGSFGSFQTVTLEDVDFSAWAGSDRVIRTEFVGNGFNLNWIEFSAVAAPSAVVDRGVAYGGASAAYGEDTVDPTKSALRTPGSTATVANYTNYSRGLNRVTVDIANLPVSVLSNVSDFQFRVGNTENPNDWTVVSGAALPTVSAAVDLGDDVSRVTLAWADDHAIKNSWLQVTVNATENTGLSAEDVFYFGNQIGDIDGSTRNGQVTVNVFDTINIRLNQSLVANSVTMTGANSDKYIYDINRSGNVNVFDTIMTRLNQAALGELMMITLPETVQAAGFQSVNVEAGFIVQADDVAVAVPAEVAVEEEAVVPAEAMVPAEVESPNEVAIAPTPVTAPLVAAVVVPAERLVAGTTTTTTTTTVRIEDVEVAEAVEVVELPEIGTALESPAADDPVLTAQPPTALTFAPDLSAGPMGLTMEWPSKSLTVGVQPHLNHLHLPAISTGPLSNRPMTDEASVRTPISDLAQTSGVAQINELAQINDLPTMLRLTQPDASAAGTATIDDVFEELADQTDELFIFLD